MTGSDFKLLRKFSGVTQQQIAEELGLKTHCSISLMEDKKLVPYHIEAILIKLCKLEKYNQNEICLYIDDIRESKEPDKKKFSFEEIFYPPEWSVRWIDFVKECNNQFKIYDINEINRLVDIGINFKFLFLNSENTVLTFNSNNFNYYKSVFY